MRDDMIPAAVALWRSRPVWAAGLMLMAWMAGVLPPLPALAGTTLPTPKSGAALKAQVAEGKQLLAEHCGGCHTVGAAGNDILPLTGHISTLGMEAYIEGQGKVLDHMPPFAGTRTQRDAIAAYVAVGLHGKKPDRFDEVRIRPLRHEVPPFDPATSAHVLLAWNTLGMKCITDCDVAYSNLPPGNALVALLIRRGSGDGMGEGRPRIVSEGVQMSYAAPPDMRRPSTQVEYWKYARSISGKELPPDVSVTGKGMLGNMDLNPKTGALEALGIPLTPYTDSGGLNPYPVFSVLARDAASGRELARTGAVLPNGTEMGCWRCHGGNWGRLGVTGISPVTARSILATHDKRNSTDLLARSDAGVPVLCQSCHPDPLLNAKGREGVVNLPAALHGFHANYLAGRGAEVCSFCHPDSPIGVTRCLRDSHAAKGMTCVTCHGHLEDHTISLLKREVELGKPAASGLLRNLTAQGPQGTAAILPRTPWTQEPDCMTCHKDYTRPTMPVSAFNVWTEGGPGLYRNRMDGTGKVPCAACHGSPHATYPSRSDYGAGRDSIQPFQYQKVDAPIGARGNCIVCHGPTARLDAAMSPHHPMR